MSNKLEKKIKICLLGASFETGNLGVSALAESSIKVILRKWPKAEIILFGCGFEYRRENRDIAGKKVSIVSVPVRFSKNIFLRHHFIWMFFLALFVKVLPCMRLKNAIAAKNKCFRELYEIDFAADITGGDSFSDIYGFKRFMLGFLVKWLVISIGKDYILLPQTYGPFNSFLCRKMAAFIFRKAKVAYSRDVKGIECANNLLVEKDATKIKFCPDMAFVLDCQVSQNVDLSEVDEVRNDDTVVVGFNISGLLYNGGYTKDNMFGLQSNYRVFVENTIDSILSCEDMIILLISHVFPPKGLEVESDLDASRKIYEKLSVKYPSSLFIVTGEYNHREIKYIIGKCDFFAGSRMHSCIAAMSQCIPTVGFAYSDKFFGVFESVGMENNVLDLRHSMDFDLMSFIKKRDETSRYLRKVIPRVQDQVESLFESSV